MPGNHVCETVNTRKPWGLHWRILLQFDHPRSNDRHTDRPSLSSALGSNDVGRIYNVYTTPHMMPPITTTNGFSFSRQRQLSTGLLSTGKHPGPWSVKTISAQGSLFSPMTGCYFHDTIHTRIYLESLINFPLKCKTCDTRYLRLRFRLSVALRTSRFWRSQWDLWRYFVSQNVLTALKAIAHWNKILQQYYQAQGNMYDHRDERCHAFIYVEPDRHELHQTIECAF